MAINVNFEKEKDLLKVIASGTDESMQEVKEYAMNIIKQARSFQCTRILCDERDLVYKLSVSETFDYAKYLADHAPRIGKVAIVCHPDLIDDAEFWENVTVNRGLAVKAFISMNIAENWLVE